MLLSSNVASLPPDTVCGYPVLRSPSAGTYVALADGGRHVLLKPLDPDCLLHGQLHPSIKERLARVRELALKSMANLHGVERDARGVFLVWEFVGGTPLESHAADLSATQLISLMRDVVLNVEALHQAGIVHGAIHARNVIIDPTGRPRLTHISPLLFHDPAVDETAVNSMLRILIDARSDIDPSLRTTLGQPVALRQLASALVASGRMREELIAFDADDRRRRRHMLFLALGAACVGLLTAGIIAVVSR